MKKNILQDIQPLTRTTVTRAKTSTTRVEVEEPATYQEQEVYQAPPPPRRHVLWFIAIPAIIVLLFSLSFIFAGATVNVVPKSKVVTLDDTVVALKDSTDPEAVSFTVMSLTDDETIDVPGETTSTASEKATGTVVIYNEYSTASQGLVATTRLQTPDKKIYRIDKQVTVPGYTKTGTTIVPGSVTVTVTADQAGPEYNIGPSDFTIPGFAGSAKFEKFFARSKSDISGGTEGQVHKISETSALAARDSLVEKARANLTQELRAQVPEDFILYDDLIFFSPDTDSTLTLSSSSASVPVSLHATISALLIHRKTLERTLAKSFTTEKDRDAVRITNLHEATATLSNKTDVSPLQTEEISFLLSGTGNAVWSIDTDALVASLLGTAKKDFQKILAQNLSVDTAELMLTPFWKMTLPTDSKDIKVHIE